MKWLFLGEKSCVSEASLFSGRRRPERESLKLQPKSSGKLPLYKGVGVALPAHGVKERGEESRIVASSRKKGRKK